MEFMAKGDKKLKSFSLFGNKKEEALEMYQKGAVSAVATAAADHAVAAAADDDDGGGGGGDIDNNHR
jgi:hypothetical protein